VQPPTAAHTALLMTAVLVAVLLSIVTATAHRMRLDSPSTGGGAHHLRRPGRVEIRQGRNLG
jgi:hypothetical protein